MTTRTAGGFTLIEVLIAIVVAGLVALLAHQLFSATVDGSRRLAHARRALDRERNAEAFLRDAFLSLDVGTDRAGPFEGDHDRVRFSTWLFTPDGWKERRDVRLGLEGRRWAAVAEPRGPIILADSVESVALDYLLEPGADARWVNVWHSPVSAPLAVRVRLTHAGGRCDTTLYLIKARG